MGRVLDGRVTLLLALCAIASGVACEQTPDGHTPDPPFGAYEFPACDFVEPDLPLTLPRPSAECERMSTLPALLTPLERALTPRAEVQLEHVALSVSDGIVADERIYQRVVCEVERIRALVPETDFGLRDGRSATTIFVYFDEGNLPSRDERLCLATALDGASDLSDRGYVTVVFDGVYRDDPIIDVYAALDGVESVSPDGIFDGHELLLEVLDDGTFRYDFQFKSGDCPSGCIEALSRVFEAKADGTIVYVSKSGRVVDY